MKRIYIVTGASGFLGNNIIRMLEHDDNAEVRAFVLNGGESISSLNNLKCLFIMVMSQRLILLILFLMVVMAQKFL